MDRKLQEYNKKRDFKKTAEPSGKIRKPSIRLHYAMQHHLASRDHYDLRLEWRGVLLSWAVPKGPSFNPADKRLAAHVEDHPLDYRDFEGLIPQGQYGGGTVMLWDEGFWLPKIDVAEGFKKGLLKFAIDGKRLKGQWSLIAMKTPQNKDHWLLIKEKDQYAQKTSGIKRYDTSIKTGQTMKEIAGIKEKKEKNPFRKASVQLAQLSDKLPTEKNWLLELKYDGYRIVSYIENDQVQLLSRNGKDYQKAFNEIAESLVDLAEHRSMICDGEIVIIDEKTGLTNFQSLQQYLKKKHQGNLHYIIFDLLALDGKDLRKKPLIERKKILQDLLKEAPSNISFSAHKRVTGKEDLATFCQKGYEGLMCKKDSSLYLGKRSSEWKKVKCDNRQEFVVGGYIKSLKSNRYIQSLLLGYFNGKDFIYAGNVGAGFKQKTLTEFRQLFSKIECRKPAFLDLSLVKNKKNITWLKPKYVVEIKFTEWTKDKLLRHASFQGWRIDKEVKDVKKEEPEKNENLEISNGEKLLYQNPKITKNEVAAYYRLVGERMLPYLRKRILSLVNCPKGIENPCFFKKHPLNHQEIKVIPIKNSQGQDEEYFYLETLEGIIAQVQLNTLEFHTWGSTIDNLEKPDVMVFDLDPDAGMPLAQIKQGVKDLKTILTKLNLQSFLKTSGGKGYHIVIPFSPTGSWKEFSEFAKKIAQIMEQKWPKRYTSNVRKNKRDGKIFIDWIRNSRGATSVAPYSLRARRGAKVSMPIAWKDLSKVAPDGIDMKTAIKKVKLKDPWKDFFEVAKSQSLR